MVSLPGWMGPAPGSIAQVRPSPTDLAAVLAPGDALPRRSSADTPARHHDWLVSKLKAAPVQLEVADSPRQRSVWARCRLVAIGERMPGEGRSSWTEGWQPDPTQDALTATILAGFHAGGWTVRRAAEDLLLPAAVRTFRGVCLARHLPGEVRDRAVHDLREAFFYRLALPDERGTPGWTELAARALETAGPFQALLGPLGPPQRRRAAVCAVSRGQWRHTAEHCLTGGTRLGRAAELLDNLDALETWLDHHLQRRLVAEWTSGRTHHDWRVVTQARGRARARLRALCAECPEALLEATLSLDALGARLLDATRRWAWTWAWEELARDFAFDIQRPVTTPCEQDDELPGPWDASRDPPLRTWVLLVVLKGRLPQLERWVHTGSTGDRDTTWGRLLADDLPASVRGTDTTAMRLELVGKLSSHLAALRPQLEAVAKLTPGRKLRAGFTALLQADWHPDVPFPRSGFPTFRRNAAHVVGVQ